MIRWMKNITDIVHPKDKVEDGHFDLCGFCFGVDLILNSQIGYYQLSTSASNLNA